MLRSLAPAFLALLLAACGRIGFEPDPALLDGGGGMDASPLATDAGTVGPRCGDGQLSGDEVCDDGNTASGDGCRADCAKEEVCGDGLADEGEGCDDGNSDPDDGCGNDCRPSCVADADCDDGEACDGEERCDAGVCVAGVTLAEGTSCGVDRVCRGARCASLTCGDGALDDGEQCDDANLVSGDGCESDCRFSCESAEACSDGEACDGEEVCDLATHTCGPAGPVPVEGAPCDRDGVAGTRDICLGETCVASRCGDGWVDPERGETCEDGNRTNGDGCDNDCRFSCTETEGCAEEVDACDGITACDVALHRCVTSDPLAPGAPCDTAEVPSGGVCVAGVCAAAGDGGAGLVDAGPVDAGLVDAGPVDAGRDGGISPVDGGPIPTDAGPLPDAGPGCPVPPLPDSPLQCFQPCRVAADCVHVEANCCCDCANGGSVEAIYSGYEGVWGQRQLMSCGSCFDVTCLSIYQCPVSGPTCVSGRCVAGSGGPVEI